MKTWLHRISWHWETSIPLLDRGYISIGFSDFSDPDYLRAVDEGGWDAFEKMVQTNWGKRPKNRLSLWKFLKDMAIGDRILVPSSGTFSVYEIIGEHAQLVRELDTNGLKTCNGDPIRLGDGGRLVTVAGRLIDLGFVRKVRLVAKDISRALYADAALTFRMKTRWTTVNIEDLKDNVDKAIEAYRRNRPINLHATLLDTAIESTISAIDKELDDAKFQKLIGWYLEKAGATDVSIPAKNESRKEGDADIVAIFEPIKTIIYVQAKKHDSQSRTSEWAVEQITAYRNQKETAQNQADAMDDGYSRIAWVVSSAGGFSEVCISRAKQDRVLLLNGRDFARLLVEAGIGGLEKVF